jgi:hypothetical protein
MTPLNMNNKDKLRIEVFSTKEIEKVTRCGPWTTRFRIEELVKNPNSCTPTSESHLQM